MMPVASIATKNAARYTITDADIITSDMLNMEMLTSDITIVTQYYGHGLFHGRYYC